MATKFTVEGPSLRGKAAKIVNSESAKLFWQKFPEFAGERGCYVFAMRAASGFTPGYVGMATKSFKREAFQPHKLAKYQSPPGGVATTRHVIRSQILGSSEGRLAACGVTPQV